MDSIIRSLSDPGAWVSGVLFSVIATAIWKWFGLIPGQVRGLFRAARLKALRKVLAARQNPMEITFAISKANAQYVAFLLMSFFFLGALLISDGFRELIGNSKTLSIVVGLPIYVFEVVWLYQDSYAKRLVQEHGKLLKYRVRRTASPPR